MQSALSPQVDQNFIFQRIINFLDVWHLYKSPCLSLTDLHINVTLRMLRHWSSTLESMFYIWEVKLS